MKTLFWIVLVIVLAGVGYYFGYDKGFETAVTATSEKQAEAEEEIALQAERIRVKDQLLGIWQSNEDSKFTREFMDTGLVIDRYHGNASATTKGEWSFVMDTSKEPVQLPAISGITVLKIIMGESMYFSVQEISTSSLSIMYLQGNRVQTYTKVGAQGESYKVGKYEIDGESFMFVNGVSEVETTPGSASKTIFRYFGNEAKEDLNNDGREDVAFLLTKEGGGSGTFYYVVVALQTEDGYQGTNGMLLGDRISPQTTEIKDGELIVNFADRKKGEAMSVSPSVGVSNNFVVSGGKLALKK